MNRTAVAQQTRIKHGSKYAASPDAPLMDSPNLSDIEAFLALADQQGFGAAARELGVTQSTISRRIAALEARIGLPLVMRTTRRVALTEAGVAYAVELRDLLAGFREADARVRSRTTEPDGLVRITMPTALGRVCVIPRIADLAGHHPRLRFDLDLSDRYVDMLDGQFDIAIRMAAPVQSGLRSQHIGSFGLGLYASPDYATRQGLPRDPADLGSHQCLALRTYRPRIAWEAIWQDREVAVQITPQISVTDSLALRALTVAGRGIAILPSYVAADDLACGALIDALPGLVFAPRDVFAAYLPHRADFRKVQVVLAALQRISEPA